MATLSLALWHRPMDMFVASQWRYGYGVGLIRRGLWGNVLDAIGAGSASSIVIASAALLVATILIGSWLLASVTVDNGRTDPTRVAVATALALSPAGFPFLAANFGRFDTPVLLLMLMALATVATGTSALHVGGAAALLGLGVLTHEAALLTAAPWAAVWIAGRVSSARTRSAGVVAGACCIAVPLVAGAALQRPSMPLHAFEEWLATRTDWPVGGLEVVVPYQSVSGAIASARGFLLSSAGLRGLVLAVIAVLPLLAALVVSLRSADVRWRDVSGNERLLFVASAAPLGLMGVGMDYGRWWTFSMILATMTTLHVLRERGRTLALSRWLLALTLASLLLTVLAGGTRQLAFLDGLL